jgi:hypothetical protein
MFARKGFVVSAWLIVVIGSAGLCGCAKPPAQPLIEEPVVTQKVEPPSPPLQPTDVPKLPPPKLEEVQEAVVRIFKDAAVIDASRTPSFLVGDFNGDQSQDLAVVLKPAAGKLSELNQEFPNWIAREPLDELLLPKSKALAHGGTSKSQPNPAAGQTVRFKQSDVLLAIIHGQGPKGWLDPEATQTHLLRDVVGTNMHILPFKEAAKAYKGIKPFPSVFGDLIQQTLIGQAGFLHFAGSLYSWYDPKNYKSEVGPAHSGMSKMR